MTRMFGGVNVLPAAVPAPALRLWRRVDALEAAVGRVHRMREAVTLLSETAEAGFAAVAQELQTLHRAPSRVPVAPATLSRRVVKASTQGERVEEIARREALSEGEVRLHLALANSSSTRKAGRRAVVRA